MRYKNLDIFAVVNTLRTLYVYITLVGAGLILRNL